MVKLISPFVDRLAHAIIIHLSRASTSLDKQRPCGHLSLTVHHSLPPSITWVSKSTPKAWRGDRRTKTLLFPLPLKLT